MLDCLFMFNGRIVGVQCTRLQTNPSAKGTLVEKPLAARVHNLRPERLASLLVHVNVRTQRRGANGIRYSTETQSPRPLRCDCWAARILRDHLRKRPVEIPGRHSEGRHTCIPRSTPFTFALLALFISSLSFVKNQEAFRARASAK